MKMRVTEIKKTIKDNKLSDSDNLISYIENNDQNLSEKELSEIAEIANANRQKNAAYYTDDFIVDRIINSLPALDKENISILEPSVGTGRFIYPLIKKLSNKYKNIHITANDIDPKSLEITKLLLNKHSIPDNVTIEYTNYDFLSNLVFSNKEYDYIVGNPPFIRITKLMAAEYGNNLTNLSAQFFLKALGISKIVALVMPKNVLSTPDYQELRNILINRNIDSIIDFGEHGFKGVLIETIALIVGAPNNGKTTIYSYIEDKEHTNRQSYITDKKFPSWLIYRNKKFDDIAKNMEFNIFTVYRDRQITNSILSDSGDIRIIKSRNIAEDGSGIIDIPGYDKYVSRDKLKKLSVSKYYKNNDVFLVPNMTYKPRMIRKNGNYIVNGSVAVLELKDGKSITPKEMSFYATERFRTFYKIARNMGTRSLNIDNNSVFWFGVLKNDRK